MSRVLVTGAQGFLGQTVLLESLGRYDEVAAATRHKPKDSSSSVAWFQTGELGPGTDWSAAVQGCETILHLAGRAHMAKDREADQLAAYRQVNVEATRRLLEAADSSGARRLVYISSVKARGECSTGCEGGIFRESDPLTPLDAYGVSKAEAEDLVRDWSARTGLEVSIVRPVLVYGPGVKANFLSLMQWILKGRPLPFGQVRNRRSLVSVENVADLIFAAASHQRAPGQTFFASDGEDTSTPGLVREIAEALGVRPRLFSVPPALMFALAGAVGKKDSARRVFGDLAVDSTRAKSVLDWKPRISRHQAMLQTADWFKSSA